MRLVVDARKDARWEIGLVVGRGEYGLEELDAGELTVTAKEPVLTGVLTGAADAEVAYMRGDLKVEGEPGPVLALLAELGGDDFRSWAQSLAELW